MRKKVFKSQKYSRNEILIKEIYSGKNYRGFPGGSVVKNPPANAGDMGSSPGPGRPHMLWSN